MPNTTLEEAMAGAEITVEETPVCVINAETRVISVPDEYGFFGVSSDEKVKRIYFKCPKIVGDNIDLSTLGLYINYQNAEGYKNIYIIDDVEIDGDDITFSWLLSRYVTIANGTVKYIVCAKKSENGNVVNEWNTKIATGTVGIGLEAIAEVEEQNADAIEQILNQLSFKESISNKVTALSKNSTDTEYPSAKAVYDEIQPMRDITVASKNKIDNNTLIAGYFINLRNGNLVVSGSNKCTDFIEVEANTNYVFSSSTAPYSETLRYALYNSSKEFISGRTGTIPTQILTTSETAYIRLSDLSTNTEWMLEAGTAATAYEPFGSLVNGKKISYDGVILDVSEKAQAISVTDLTGLNIAENVGKIFQWVNELGTEVGAVGAPDFSVSLGQFFTIYYDTNISAYWYMPILSRSTQSISSTSSNWELATGKAVYNAIQAALYVDSEATV